MTTIVNTAPAASKASLAKPIFDQVTHPDFKLPEGFKSPRGVFIQRAIAEAGMTKAGASTYFQNFSNEAKGGKRYWQAPKAKAAAATEEAK